MWGVGEEDRRTRSSFFFNDTATTEIYTLSLHDALPILHPGEAPEPVPDEVRRILRDDASLAQDPLPEVANEPDDLGVGLRSEEHTSELQSRQYLVCRLLLEKNNKPLPALSSICTFIILS